MDNVCKHRNPNGQCAHLIMADGNGDTAQSMCPTPHIGSRACELDKKVEDALWSGEFDRERSGLARAKTPQQRDGILDTIRRKIVPSIVRQIRFKKFVEKENAREDYTLRRGQNYRRGERSGRPTCDIFAAVWTKDGCVEPHLSCSNCPIALGYVRLFYKRQEDAIDIGEPPETTRDKARVDAITSYFASQS